MKNELLDQLVKNKDLLGYEYIQEEYEPKSGCRETEKLVLTFPSGNKLILETFCSGSSENTVLLIS